MTKVRRRAGWLAVLGLAMGLTLLPGVGVASGPLRLYEPADPPQVGDPDTPPSVRRGFSELETRGVIIIIQPPFSYFSVVPKSGVMTRSSCTKKTITRGSCRR